MIEIGLTTALIIYSALLGVFGVIIWLYTEITTRRSFFVLERQDLWRCIFCGYTYLDQKAESVSQCPRCQSYNSPSDKHVRYVPDHHAQNVIEHEEEPGRNTSHRKRPHQRHRGPRRR